MRILLVIPFLLLFSVLFSVSYGFETEGVPVSVIGGMHSFGEPIHQDITREGLYFLKPEPLETIVSQHVIIEQDQSSPNHFDNCQFSETIDRINARYDVAVSAFNPSNPQPTLAAEKFGMILHAVQDFYSHTNWIEMKRTDLVDPWFEHWRQLNAYSDTTNDRPVFVLEEDGSPHMDFLISTRNKKVTINHESWDALGSGRKAGLISGTFDADINKCPPNASIPHGGKLLNRFNRTPESDEFPNELNKDNPAIKGHAAARGLAVQQTTHEFCRLVELTRQAYGQRGVDIIYDSWVQGQYQIDSPYNNARCEPPTGTSAISDKSHVSIGSKDKLAKTQKIKTGTTEDKKLVKTGTKITLTNDEIKSIYKITKLYESTAAYLASANDQQKIILQKATSAANKDLTKEQKTNLKTLLKEQDSDKKNINLVKDYAKIISGDIKKIAQKQGIKSLDLDKITKTTKKDKQGNPINQLKQDAVDAKNNLDNAAKIDPTELARITSQIGGIQSKSDYEKKIEKQREALQTRLQLDSDEQLNSIMGVHNLLVIMQKHEQAQTDSILSTLPDPYEQAQNKDPVVKKDPSKPATTSNVISLQSKRGTYIEPENPCTSNNLLIAATWVLAKSSNIDSGSVTVLQLDLNKPGAPSSKQREIKDGVIQYSEYAQHPGHYQLWLAMDGKTIHDGLIDITIPNLCIGTSSSPIIAEPGGGFTVTNTKPILTIPKQITKEATGSSGALVDYTPIGIDKEDGSITPTCNPPPASIFPIGTTTVTCTVTDSKGESVSGTFTVTVRDTTPPNIPAFQPREGVKDESGIQVFYEVTATDLVDGPVQVSCNYPSGYKFPIGVTILTCTADDSRGNHGTRSLQITVTPKESGQ